MIGVFEPVKAVFFSVLQPTTKSSQLIFWSCHLCHLHLPGNLYLKFNEKKNKKRSLTRKKKLPNFNTILFGFYKTVDHTHKKKLWLKIDRYVTKLTIQLFFLLLLWIKRLYCITSLSFFFALIIRASLIFWSNIVALFFFLEEILWFEQNTTLI